MFVVLSGHVAITQRDGFGRRHAGDRSVHRSSSSPRSRQLSGRVALVDGHAEGDVETLLIPPEQLRALLIAEADLGERIMRALILRRVEPDPGQRWRPGFRSAGSQLRRCQRACRTSCRATVIRIIVLDPATDKDAADLDRALCRPRAAELPLVVVADGTVLRNPSESLNSPARWA